MPSRQAAEDVLDLGENRVQELLGKKDLVPANIRWHMIGRLQSNKVKYIVPFIHCIHSVDSRVLLDEIQRHAMKNNRTVDIMLEVNVSGEPQKGGVLPDQIMAMASHAATLTNTHVTGLMTVATDTDNKSILHAQFALLRNLRDDVRRAGFANVPATELSMGMSHDFEIAIAEGATMVRLGTALFGSRNNASLPS